MGTAVIRAIVLVTAQSLRRRPLRSAMAIVAVAAGASLAVGVFAAQRSAQNSVLELNSDLAGAASLRVTSFAGHGGLPDDMADTVAEVGGVRAAVPMIHTAAMANDSRNDESVVTAIGVDCRVSALIDAVGCDGEEDALEAFDGVVVSARLRDALGDDGVIRTAIGRIPVRDAAAVDELDRFNQGRVVVVSLPRAQELFSRPSSVDSVFVVAEDGVDVDALRGDIQSAVGDWVRVGPADGLFRGADTFAPITAGLTIIGLLALAIGAQLVYNAVSLSLEERRRETATLSALGGRPRAVAAVMFAEAAILGLAGGFIGIAGASFVESRLIRDLDQVVSGMSSVQLVSHTSAVAPMLSVVAGVAVATVAAIRPARNAARLDLGAELSASSVRVESGQRLRPWRVATWSAVAAAGLVLSWWGGRGGSLDRWQVPTLYAGLLLTLPAISRAAGLAGPVVLDALRRRLGHRFDGRTAVALARLVREPGRTGAMTLAVSAAVAMGIVLAGFQAGMDAGAAQLARDDSGERVVVSTMRADNTLFIDSGPSAALAQAIADHPAVGDVHEQKLIEVDLPSGPDVVVSTLPPSVGFEVYDGEQVGNSQRGGEVMLGPALARHLDARAGDTVTVPGRDGFDDLVVSGVWASPSNQGFSMAMAERDLEQIWGPQPVYELAVNPAPGTSLDELARTLRSSDLDPDLRVWTPDELASAFAEIWDDFFGPFDSLQQALIVVATVAVVSTLLLVGVQRQREDGVLAAVGLAPHGLAGLALVEAAVVTALGVVFGTMSGVVTMVAMVQASEMFSGLSIPFRFVPGSVATSGAALVLVIGVAALIPAWRTSRLAVVEALQYE